MPVLFDSYYRGCHYIVYTNNVGSCFSDDEDDDYEVDDAHGMDDEMTDAYELFMQQQQNKLQ